MNNAQTIREGTPCRAAAMAVATSGFVIFGAITLAAFLVPDRIRTGHYFLGGMAGLLTLLMYPWQILDTKRRRHILTANSATYRCGVLSTFEVEVPYRSMQAIAVRRGFLQRMFGCGDVLVSAHGVSGPGIISQQDSNSVCIRSIRDFAEVADLLRQKMHDHGSHNSGAQDTLESSRS